MKQYIVKNQKKLALGYTTGSCAAGAAKAAAQALLSGQPVRQMQLMTPKGIALTLDIEHMTRTPEQVRCAVRKDAGDDPDITHGILIYAKVQKIPAGVVIDGGEGVGRVTKSGLAQPVGTAAINPGPREQITRAVQDVAHKYGYTGGFSVVISIPEGRELGARTFNPKLGIVGGLSVLGTSGIVEPMSEKALVDTIRLELDSLYAQGQRIAFLCPGNYGADFARDTLGLDLERAVKCSNFIGEAFDHAAYRGYPEILLIGHAGKLVKMAAGVMNTHSSVADARQEIFTAHAALCGAPHDTLAGLMEAISVDACIDLLDEAGLRGPVLARIGKEMEKRIALRMKGRARVEFIMFTGKYGVLAESAGARELCERLKQQ